MTPLSRDSFRNSALRFGHAAVVDAFERPVADEERHILEMHDMPFEATASMS
jgi:hypothetical protein